MNKTKKLYKQIFLLVSVGLLSACCQIMPCSVGVVESGEQLEPIEEPNDQASATPETTPSPDRSFYTKKAEPSQPAITKAKKRVIPQKHEISTELSSITELIASNDGRFIVALDKANERFSLIRMHDLKTILTDHYQPQTDEVEEKPVFFSQNGAALGVYNPDSFTVYRTENGTVVRKFSDASFPAKFSWKNEHYLSFSGEMYDLRSGERWDFRKHNIKGLPNIMPNKTMVAVYAGTSDGFGSIYTLKFGSEDEELKSYGRFVDRGDNGSGEVVWIPSDLETFWEFGALAQKTANVISLKWPELEHGKSFELKNRNLKGRRVFRKYYQVSYDADNGNREFLWLNLETRQYEHELEINGKIYHANPKDGLFAYLPNGGHQNKIRVIDSAGKTAFSYDLEKYSWLYSENKQMAVIRPDLGVVAGLIAHVGPTGLESGGYRMRLFSIKDKKVILDAPDCNHLDDTESLLLCWRKDLKVYSLLDHKQMVELEEGRFKCHLTLPTNDQVVVALEQGKLLVITGAEGRKKMESEADENG